MESPSLRMGATSSLAQPRIPSSVFEGLFVRGMEPHGALARALDAEGYHPRCPEVDYPVSTWKRCVFHARNLVYGQLSDPDAYRLLGRKLTEGFANTLIGRVAAVALPMIGPALVVERLPRYLAMMGRPDLQVRLVSRGERERVATIPDIHNPPEFIAGALEVALELAHARPIILVEDRSPPGFRLHIRW
jgi:uncharacterized protein (TIGR02265 family)